MIPRQLGGAAQQRIAVDSEHPMGEGLPLQILLSARPGTRPTRGCPVSRDLHVQFTVDLTTVESTQQQTWSTGDYGRIGTTLVLMGELLYEAANLRAGNRVLDVATGSSNTAPSAAPALPGHQASLRTRLDRSGAGRRKPSQGRRRPRRRRTDPVSRRLLLTPCYTRPGGDVRTQTTLEPPPSCCGSASQRGPSA